MTLINYTAFTYIVLYLQNDKIEQVNVVEHSDSLSAQQIEIGAMGDEGNNEPSTSNEVCHRTGFRRYSDNNLMT